MILYMFVICIYNNVYICIYSVCVSVICLYIYYIRCICEMLIYNIYIICKKREIILYYIYNIYYYIIVIYCVCMVCCTPNRSVLPEGSKQHRKCVPRTWTESLQNPSSNMRFFCIMETHASSVQDVFVSVNALRKETISSYCILCQLRSKWEPEDFEDLKNDGMWMGLIFVSEVMMAMSSSASPKRKIMSKKLRAM